MNTNFGYDDEEQFQHHCDEAERDALAAQQEYYDSFDDSADADRERAYEEAVWHGAA